MWICRGTDEFYAEGATHMETRQRLWVDPITAEYIRMGIYRPDKVPVWASRNATPTTIPVKDLELS
jgi:hypothetical protein